MHVFRHNHVRPEFQAVPPAGGIKGIHQETPDIVPEEQRQSMMAGEGQFVGAAWVFRASPELSDKTVGEIHAFTSHKERQSPSRTVKQSSSPPHGLAAPDRATHPTAF
jgi:hypothetical protein